MGVLVLLEKGSPSFCWEKPGWVWVLSALSPQLSIILGFPLGYIQGCSSIRVT
jgi:hypothetical protein